MFRLQVKYLRDHLSGPSAARPVRHIGSACVKICSIAFPTAKDVFSLPNATPLADNFSTASRTRYGNVGGLFAGIYVSSLKYLIDSLSAYIVLFGKCNHGDKLRCVTVNNVNQLFFVKMFHCKPPFIRANVNIGYAKLSR